MDIPNKAIEMLPQSIQGYAVIAIICLFFFARLCSRFSEKAFFEKKKCELEVLKLASDLDKSMGDGCRERLAVLTRQSIAEIEKFSEARSARVENVKRSVRNSLKYYLSYIRTRPNWRRYMPVGGSTAIAATVIFFLWVYTIKSAPPSNHIKAIIVFAAFVSIFNGVIGAATGALLSFESKFSAFIGGLAGFGLALKPALDLFIVLASRFKWF